MDINEIQRMVEDDGIVFISYGGFLSQALISAMTEALEKEAEVNEIELGVSVNIFTIFIELSQNMMNYSKSSKEGCRDIAPGGLIVVSRDKNGEKYFIHSQNIVSIDDKEKMEPKLIETQSLDKEGIKQRYKELRRSGANTHGKGGGIGFYEIAKRCDKIEYDFKEINSDKYYFHIKTTISTKKGE